MALAVSLSFISTSNGMVIESREPTGNKGVLSASAILDSRALIIAIKDVIIQMFEWTWDSIASECTNFIGPSGMWPFLLVLPLEVLHAHVPIGYGFVQTSPPQEHIQG